MKSVNPKFRQVFRYKGYFNDFFDSQPIKIKKKRIWTLTLIEEIEQVPENYLKHLTGTEGLYEVRVKFGSNAYRILCFFDDGKLVVLMNAFQKKTNKTPKQEIKLAEKIKKQYESEK